MIYTVTLNPALDYIVFADDFEAGKINRAKSTVIYPGGKGINVSLMLKNLGHKSTALGFFAGFTGSEILNMLFKEGISTEPVFLENGLSRINVKLKSNDETEINGQGPNICGDDINKLYDKLNNLKANDFVVLAGSIPSTLSENTYCDIMSRLDGKDVNVVLDAEKNLLVNTLKYKPFLIKPNNKELGDIFGVDISTRSDALKYAKRLADMGAQNVLVSMAGEGAVFVSNRGDVYESTAPKGCAVNSVGAGDSMVAGFIAGFIEKNSLEYAFKMGICAGSASAFSQGFGTREAVDELYLSLR